MNAAWSAPLLTVLGGNENSVNGLRAFVKFLWYSQLDKTVVARTALMYSNSFCYCCIRISSRVYWHSEVRLAS